MVALGPEPKSIGGLGSLDCFLSIAFSRHRPILGPAACSQASAASGWRAIASVRKSDRPVLVAKAPYAACAGRVRRRHQTGHSWSGLPPRCKPAAGPILRSDRPPPVSPDVSRSSSRPEGLRRELTGRSCVAVSQHPILGGPIPMGRSEEYRRFAAECLEMASAFDNPQARAVLLQMAQVWFRLASEVTVGGDAPENQTCSD
jgi:hypothetical protein